ncbi:aldo/keto reductase [Desulfonema ishimotonii]|uniref:Aldo/keto reductase n=1 Tax=Desulfonema ishimotonii TaxID=45657 RepID=A0A401FU43_9BACT|nr:aldo/keto reductase [Desulfonema ishimotonii]GBC60489.1 aldo/keto reductase [Desulfonema ishimotonii]
MEFRTLGKTDIELSAVIMGTWQAGKAMWADVEDAQTTRAMQAAFDAGITTFDTATVYGDGHSEQILGKALKEVRPQVVIATKVFAHALAYDKVFAACHKSLRDLDTDYIDLYQIHWPAGSFGSKKIPIEETMKALTELKKQGKIRAIGVSNFSAQQIEEAARYGQVESLQPPYSLFWRQVETDTMPWCAENDITVMAYSPMAQGFLTGKFGPDHTFRKGDHRAKNRLFEPENYERVQDALARLRPIAERNDITLGQLALAWVISHTGTCAIAGARNADQALQNAKAGSVKLSDDEMAEIDAIGRTVTEHIDDNPVQWKW